MNWDLLIDKEEMIYIGLYAVFCISCWSIIALMFWAIYGILSLFEFIDRQIWKIIERMKKHGRKRKRDRSDEAEMDG